MNEPTKACMVTGGQSRPTEPSESIYDAISRIGNVNDRLENLLGRIMKEEIPCSPSNPNAPKDMRSLRSLLVDGPDMIDNKVSRACETVAEIESKLFSA